jgi:hypothetical protein
MGHRVAAMHKAILFSVFAVIMAAWSLPAGAQNHITVPGITVNVVAPAPPEVPTETATLPPGSYQIPMRTMPIPRPPQNGNMTQLPTEKVSSDNPQPIRSKECQDAISDAKKNCDSGSLTSTAAGVMQSLAAAGPGRPGDAYAACKAMKAQATVAAGGSVMVGTMCIQSAHACERTCTDQFSKGYALDQRGANYCKGFEHSGEIGLVGGLGTSLAGFLQANSCEQIIGAMMAGCPPMNMQCMQFCITSPAACNPQNCTGPEAQNNFYCEALNGLNGNSFPSGGVAGLTDPTGGAFDESGQGFQGYKSGSHQANQGSNDGNPPGGMGFGSSAYPGGKDAQAAAKDQSSYYGDIDHGFSGGSGGGWPTGSSNVNGLRGGKDGIDLSQYLPGGDLDPRRGIASVEDLKSKGITGANDLSNFEKVTRMMNKKRPYMKPGSN